MRFKPIKSKDNADVTVNVIGNNLANLIKKSNLSASHLAHKVELPVMTIRRLLSGETADPRLSTLKIIADYFQISIDQLVESDKHKHLLSTKNVTTYSIPKIGWEHLTTLEDSLEKLNFDIWEEWQSISLPKDHILSSNAFALESRPSMYPRFPKGTLFIIDPALTPADGDIVLVQLKENNEFTLRELIIDPPDWRLAPLIANSNTLNFAKEKHTLIGVSLLTLLFNPKLNG